MLIQKRFWEPIAAGEVTVVFRRWKRSQIVSGRTYRTAAGRLSVSDVSIVSSPDISDSDAQKAGYESADAVLSDLRGEPDDPIFRIEFAHHNEPDPRMVLANQSELSQEELDEISHRLERLDRASKVGPWTIETLELIQEHPERRAPDLAAIVGRETQPFKLDVRKLKNLGLTLSFRIGYRLSPRGVAYLEYRQQ